MRHKSAVRAGTGLVMLTVARAGLSTNAGVGWRNGARGEARRPLPSKDSRGRHEGAPRTGRVGALHDQPHLSIFWQHGTRFKVLIGGIQTRAFTQLLHEAAFT